MKSWLRIVAPNNQRHADSQEEDICGGCMLVDYCNVGFLSRTCQMKTNRNPELALQETQLHTLSPIMIISDLEAKGNSDLVTKGNSVFALRTSQID